MRYRVKFYGDYKDKSNGRKVSRKTVWFITVESRQELLNELSRRLPGLFESALGPAVTYGYRKEPLANSLLSQ